MTKRIQERPTDDPENEQRQKLAYDVTDKQDDDRRADDLNDAYDDVAGIILPAAVIAVNLDVLTFFRVNVSDAHDRFLSRVIGSRCRLKIRTEMRKNPVAAKQFCGKYSENDDNTQNSGE